MDQEREWKSRRKKAISVKTVIALLVGVLVFTGTAFGAYVHTGKQYKTAFFPNTMINGINSSEKTIDEVKQRIASELDGYKLTIEKRGGETEEITGEEINLHSEFDGSLETILANQNTNQWLKYIYKESSHQIETMIAYDEDALDKKMDSLACFDTASTTPAKDAYLSEYTPEQGYLVLPEEEGNRVDADLVKERIKGAITSMSDRISLEEEQAYQAPSRRQDNVDLNELKDNLNRYVNTVITYDIAGQEEVLDGNTVHTWLSVGENQEISLDREAVSAYVKELAKKHNTAGTAKNFKTSYGSTITLSRGSYGFRINQSAETEELIRILEEGESQKREPVYSQKAASRGANDYGTTYVEINLTAQHLFFYKDGNLITESDFVSGNLARGWGTPEGIYPLTYKQRNATLKGEGYATPVDYWMPFNGGVGMHDATWRSSFGGTIYKTGGSHGCINLPHAVAKKIYENISSGIPVICYNLAGTEKGSSSTAAPTETTPTETTPAVTAPAETTPAATTSAETTPTLPQGPGELESTATPTPEGAVPTKPAVPESSKADPSPMNPSPVTPPSQDTPQPSSGNGEYGPGM